MVKELLQKIKKRGFNQILLLLLLTDVFFIFIHIFHKLPPIKGAIPILQDQAFSISEDLSLAEAFQYIKEFWVVLLLIGYSIKNRKLVYIGWILLFSFLVFDDMFGIHEWLGGIIGENLNIPAFLNSRDNLRSKDFGELIASGLFGFFFLGLIIIAYLRGSAQSKTIFNDMFALLLILVFFGVGVDFIDRFANSRILQESIKLIEDGGEMVAMSFFCWYVFSLPDIYQD